MVIDYKNNKKGFALLITIIVVSIVLAIGLSLLIITLKQLVLSGTSRDSELAFHAAYAGAECAQYFRVTEHEAFIDGQDVTLECQEQTSTVSPTVEIADEVDRYDFSATWGSSNNLCTEFSMYILDARNGEVTFQLPNYEEKVCEDGGTCTAIFSRGYNRPCSAPNSVRTVQREVVLIY